MGLGPPTCDDCRVWLRLEVDSSRGWYCPVCDKDSNNGYKHLRDGHVNDESMIPFLRFMKGKSPNVVD